MFIVFNLLTKGIVHLILTKVRPDSLPMGQKKVKKALLERSLCVEWRALEVQDIDLQLS